MLQIGQGSPQFLKYNFPPISSGLRKTSLRRGQKRHSDTPPLEANHASKLIPILKSTRPNGSAHAVVEGGDDNAGENLHGKRKRLEVSRKIKKKSLVRSSGTAKQDPSSRGQFGFAKKVRLWLISARNRRKLGFIGRKWKGVSLCT